MSFHYKPKIITDGLIYYADIANQKSFTLDSSVLRDMINNYDAYLTNMDGSNFINQYGGVLEFNGIDEKIASGLPYVDLGFEIGDSDWTASTWYYADPSIDTPNWRSVFGVGSSYTLGFHIEPARFLSYDTGVGAIVENYTIEYGRWNNVTAVHTLADKRVDVYLNSIFDGSVGYTVSLPINGAQQIIYGYRGTSTQYFWGYIGMGQIYNRTLSSNEVSRNYNALKSRYGL